MSRWAFSGGSHGHDHAPNRRFFDKVVKNSSLRWNGVNDARRYLQAMKEFQDPLDLLYRLIKPQVGHSCPGRVWAISEIWGCAEWQCKKVSRLETFYRLPVFQFPSRLSGSDLPATRPAYRHLQVKICFQCNADNCSFS
jgi:hypothetical protein